MLRRRRVQLLVVAGVLACFALSLLLWAGPRKAIPSTDALSTPGSPSLPSTDGSTSLSATPPPGKGLVGIKPGSVITGANGGRATAPPIPGWLDSTADSHRLTVTVTSASPISGVGFLIPTSSDAYYGIAKKLSTSWTLTTTVSGRPYFAAIFIRANRAGDPVTCSISIDGRLATRQTANGPYRRQGCVS